VHPVLGVAVNGTAVASKQYDKSATTGFSGIGSNVNSIVLSAATHPFALLYDNVIVSFVCDVTVLLTVAVNLLLLVTFVLHVGVPAPPSLVVAVKFITVPLHTSLSSAVNVFITGFAFIVTTTSLLYLHPLKSVVMVYVPAFAVVTFANVGFASVLVKDGPVQLYVVPVVTLNVNFDPIDILSPSHTSGNADDVINEKFFTCIVFVVVYASATHPFPSANDFTE